MLDDDDDNTEMMMMMMIILHVMRMYTRALCHSGRNRLTRLRVSTASNVISYYRERRFSILFSGTHEDCPRSYPVGH